MIGVYDFSGTRWKRWRLYLLLSRGLALFLCCELFSYSTAAEPLNVLFLIADDLNCDLGCYGNSIVRTPHIDALARQGVRFDHAYCQYPLCSPSRTSFLTGRRPNATRIVTNPRAGRFSTDYTGTPHFREFIPDTVTLPQLFRQHNYQVARIGKLYHYGVPGQIGTSGLDDLLSWDFVVNPAGRDKAEENQVFSLRPGSYGGTLSWHAASGEGLEQTDGLVATAAISLLEEYRDKPFFLAVGFYRPHTPYVSPKKYFDMYPSTSIHLPTLSPDDIARRPSAAYGSAKAEQQNMTDGLRQQAIQGYWASISFMDAQVGRVLECLDRLGLRDRTVVVMTSDHGYHMYQHGLWQKMSLFENSARVPLIISAPDMRGNGRVTESLTELVDIYPTLADLCGLSAPDYLDGVSLRRVLESTEIAVKDAAYTQVNRGRQVGYSVRTNRWRYTIWGGDGEAGHQLYDMEADPQETRNLADDPQHEGTRSMLKEKLKGYKNGGGE
ncbi:MAG: sulfatase [Pirellulaceae bacterium]|nr:sulfatase [Planctomycetales bacterium]